MSIPLLLVTFLISNLTQSSFAMSTKIIDSHLHVWADSKEAVSFPYAENQSPPEQLADRASKSALLQNMDKAGVTGSLIVQPINHKFDHTYVLSAINENKRFKAMMLHNPNHSSNEAVSQLEDLALKGFVGVRFNPYLWPEKEDGSGWEPMSKGAGLSVYKRCAELQMPVGVMCFKGLDLHLDDIKNLLEASPKTTMILDHFGFTSCTEKGDAAFQDLLELAKYPQVVVKISALFRLSDSSPYEKVKRERFEPLLKTFGPSRLMYGSDFPFVLEQEPEKYEGMVNLVSSWMEDDSVRSWVMGKTAERLFGPWNS